MLRCAHLHTMKNRDFIGWMGISMGYIYIYIIHICVYDIYHTYIYIYDIYIYV